MPSPRTLRKRCIHGRRATCCRVCGTGYCFVHNPKGVIRFRCKGCRRGAPRRLAPLSALHMLAEQASRLPGIFVIPGDEPGAPDIILIS